MSTDEPSPVVGCLLPMLACLALGIGATVLFFFTSGTVSWIVLGVGVLFIAGAFGIPGHFQEERKRSLRELAAIEEAAERRQSEQRRKEEEEREAKERRLQEEREAEERKVRKQQEIDERLRHEVLAEELERRAKLSAKERKALIRRELQARGEIPPDAMTVEESVNSATEVKPARRSAKKAPKHRTKS